MIYDPITRQQVTLLGRYRPQRNAYKFGGVIRGTFRFVKIRYETPVPGGFAVGEERDCDINYLVADNGVREIADAYEKLPLLTKKPVK